MTLTADQVLAFDDSETLELTDVPGWPKVWIAVMSGAASDEIRKAAPKEGDSTADHFDWACLVVSKALCDSSGKLLFEGNHAVLRNKSGKAIKYLLQRVMEHSGLSDENIGERAEKNLETNQNGDSGSS